MHNPETETNGAGSVHVTEECRQIRRNLPHELLNEPDGSLPSGFHQHLLRCRSCFETFAALYAAAALARPVGVHGTYEK